jgi:hypothetical protein
MKKFAWAALATLLANGAFAADTALYLRGGFNGWGIDNALVHKGKGIYETRVSLTPGNHPFKVGTSDWSAEWIISPEKSVSITPGTAYPLGKHAGPEDYLFVRQSADYTFRLDMADPARPRLQVFRIETRPAAPVNPHRTHRSVVARSFLTFDGKRETVRFSTPDAAAPLRSYVQSTTMQLRDPGPQFVTYRESAGLPVVRSGNLAFDALFAMAGAEMKQNSVDRISDGNYGAGAPVDCVCFETGEKWHYVWTRDLSYAADLGLAMLDPERVVNSLAFKLSSFRDGIARAPAVPGRADGLQIIQDTGSGGSWPVSTDRVVWAFGAEKALQALPPAKRKEFAAQALAALANTLEIDRVAAFDPHSGLYTGEQSFLDWRDQSYAAWIVNDLASLASSKALSTNVGHYKALLVAASLAREAGNGAAAGKYTAWASALKTAINQRLWLKDAGMYSSLTAPHFDGAPMAKFDWLGQALAIVTGVADEERARSILARYPHGQMGAPVIYPQQQGMPVYHNRAIWPFVTAYGLKAAVIGRNVSVADAAYDTLMRGAALNLSNMENLEWLSGQPLLLDEKNPSLIGPVINSRRQLWSVGAYLGMVIGNVFGVQTSETGITVQPFITARLRRATFGHADVIALNGLQLQGRQLSVRVHLPAAAKGDGYYAVAGIRLNGAATGAAIDWDKLAARNVIDITLGELQAGEQAIRRVSADPYSEAENVFAPPEPASATLAPVADGAIELRFTVAPGVVHHIYRNGQLAASGVQGPQWIDRAPGAAPCYALEAQFAASGNRSHHSRSTCLATPIEVPASFPAWGKPGALIATDAFQVSQGGAWQVQVRYHNGANQINLGISGGVKWLTVRDADGTVVAQGVVQLPHARFENGKPLPVYSTPLAAQLAAGSYRLELGDFYNMSYLRANSSFTAAGGAGGPSNLIDVLGFRLQRTDSL